MPSIERDVFVLSDKLKDPIDYVQNTNAIPIVFHFRDYAIPSGATANIFVQKPSGKAVYATAAISENDITVTITTQMVAEVGFSNLQIQVSDNGQELATFVYPVNVHKNLTDPDAEESKNEASFFSDLEQAAQAANNAAEAANEAAESVPGLVNTYLEEHPVSVDATPILQDHVLIFPVGTYPAS